MIDINTNVDIRTLQADKFKNIDSENLDDKKLRQVTDDFESFFMQQLMDISLKSTKIAGEGVGSDIVKGMYVESLSRQSGGSLGISDMLYNFLSENRK